MAVWWIETGDNIQKFDVEDTKGLSFSGYGKTLAIASNSTIYLQPVVTLPNIIEAAI